MKPSIFANKLLKWYAHNGRKDLPWRKNITPYRVWVSEIMLQQTQVNTVIPYYQQFMRALPDVKRLAAANVDHVLQLWSGLGYYARARNLHSGAQLIVQQYKAKFPKDINALQQIPGIGRSTAGAIAAISFDLPAAILDGNVKRVLTRFHAIEGWPGKSDIMATLWSYAKKYTPKKNVADYTQAIMDLGAMICTRGKPTCQHCPLNSQCIANQLGTQLDYPTTKPKKLLPTRQTAMLLLRSQHGEILLAKRPPLGIWGGLWSFPECSVDADVATWCTSHYPCTIKQISHWPVFRHSFSHFHLQIFPILIDVSTKATQIMESDRVLWYKLPIAKQLGLASPIKKILAKL